MTFAAIVLLGSPRRAADRYLAAFFLLLAGNQASELAHYLDFAPSSTAWQRAAFVFAVFDPLALYAFAALHPARNRLFEGWRPWGVLAASALLAFAAIFFEELPGQLPLVVLPAPGVLVALWATFTAGIYLVVLAHFLRPLLSGETHPSAWLLAPALLLVSLPALARAADATVGSALAVLGFHLAGRLFWVLPLAIAAVLLWRATRHAVALHPRDRTRLRLFLAAGLVLSLPHGIWIAFVGVWYTTGARPAFEPLLDALRILGPALRWLAFEVLVSAALIRHEMLGMSLGARRRAARALVALAFGGGGLVLVSAARSAFGWSALDFSPAEWLVLAVALAASQGVRGLVDRIAALLYGVPRPGDRASAIAAYEAAAREAAQAGPPLAASEPLSRLRSELGLDEATARTIERLVEGAPEGALAPGRKVGGRYRVERLLDRGASGRAFLAQDELLQRAVVLKEVPAGSERTVEKALAEARVAGSLRHANVVTLHDVLRAGDRILLVMEHVAGGSLAASIEARGRAGTARGILLLDGVLAGLEELHRRGIVHRDVKPANILLHEDGTPAIADFGTARLRRGATAAFDEADVFRGTPAFSAPEQLDGRVATPAADVYAVGLLARRCIEPPLPQPVERVVRRALDPDPAARWADAHEMRRALARAAATR